jgi:Coenzyme PQQ synthesis protein D (PqqD)
MQKISYSICKNIAIDYNKSGGLILDLSNNKYIGFNEFASDIFKLIQQKSTNHEIIESVTIKYDLDPQLITQYVTDFLEDVLTKKIVFEVEDGVENHG